MEKMFEEVDILRRERAIDVSGMMISQRAIAAMTEYVFIHLVLPNFGSIPNLVTFH